MTNYYVSVGDDRRGPFTLDQLKAKTVPLAPHTLVWHRGMSDWAAASNVPELGALLGSIPNEPPLYRSPGDQVCAGPVPATTVPQWILIYAVVVTPALWIVQRAANLIELFDERDWQGFNNTVLMFLFWSLVTVVITGVIVAGGLRLKYNPNAKPTLLRAGLGCSIALGVLLVALVLIMAGVASSRAASPDTSAGGGVADLAGYVSVAVWLVTQAVNVLSWAKIGRWARVAASSNRCQ